MTVLDGQSPEAVRETARVLAAGELAGVPTETVYGLAARADRDEAVAKIFAAKGRPSDHPLIVHVLDEQGARHHLWAGIATYPTHALDATSLLLAADAALRDAMAWKQSRIELATLT